MNDLPDDIRWIPESQMLDFCRLSRSTFRSWSKSGLEIATANGAYGLAELVSLVLLRAAREFLSPKKVVGAWSNLESEGAIGSLVAAARKLEKDGRFDLVVDPEYSELEVVFSDEELIAAVRKPGWARSVVVIDVAEPIRRMVRAFDSNANRTPRPKERAPGRPRRPEPGTLHSIDEKASA